MKWTIGKRLWVGLSAICLIIAIFITSFVVALFEKRKKLEQIEELQKIEKIFLNARVEHAELLKELSDMIAFGSNLNKHLDYTQTKFGRWYTEYEPTNIYGLSKTFEEIKTPYKDLYTTASEVKKYYQEENIEQSKEIYKNKVEQANSTLQKKTDVLLVNILRPRIDELTQEVKNREIEQIFFIIGILMSAILSALIVGVVLIKKIASPIKTLTSFTLDASNKDDFSQAIELKTKDDLNDLAENFNILLQKVNKTISELEENSMELALGLSECFDVLKRLAQGDPDVRVAITPFVERALVKDELLFKLGEMINKTAEAMSEIVGHSHQMAMGLCENFEVLKRVSEGDLTVKPAQQSENELLTKLSIVTDQMIKSLRVMVITIFSTAERVSSSTTQLASSTQDINGTITEVSENVQQIARGAEYTAEKVKDTLKLMEQMSSSVTQVAASAQQTAITSTQANQSAQKGGLAVKDAVTKMNKIYESVTGASKTVRKLGQASEDIGNILNVITDISDQTNLLALNAAIEAARAGESGRGFAVVAEEVRKLAEGSAKSAEEIGKLIEEIQVETNAVVSSMEVGSKEVSEGRDVVSKAGQALENVIKTFETTANMVEQISAATEQMSSATAKVIKSINDISSTAEETASATEEVSASTEEVTASMEEMTASARELTEMAVTMKELVGKFKVDDASQEQKS